MYCTLPSSAVVNLLLPSPAASMDLKMPCENLNPSSTSHRHITAFVNERTNERMKHPYYVLQPVLSQIISQKNTEKTQKKTLAIDSIR